jgi:biotin transporter BioY
MTREREPLSFNRFAVGVAIGLGVLLIVFLLFVLFSLPVFGDGGGSSRTLTGP